MDKIGQTAMAVVQRARDLASPDSHSNVPALPTSTASPPALLNRYTDIELPRLFDSWIPDVGARAIVRALAAGERSALQARAHALRAGLAAYHDGERHAVEAEIAAMLGGFRSLRQQGDDAEGMVVVTAAVLREFPLWAIAQGCMKIARRDAGLDPRYAPNDTEIFGVVQSVVKEYRKTLATVEGLLAAPVEALPAPKPTREELEARLGRKIVGRVEKSPRPQPLPRNDGKHMQRVADDLARRRAELGGV